MMVAGFETRVGGTVPFPKGDELTPEQNAFLLLTQAVGMPRLDADTWDEFVRRAELYQTYITHFLYEKGEPVLVGRAILAEMLGDYQAAWTNASRITRARFEAMIQKEKGALVARK